MTRLRRWVTAALAIVWAELTSPEHTDSWPCPCRSCVAYYHGVITWTEWQRELAA